METISKTNQEILLKKIHNRLDQHLKRQELPDSVIHRISEPLYLKYFTYYPYLFNDAFDFFDEEKLDLLSVAGFLYYKSVLLIDTIFDKKKSDDRFSDYMIANICQEESIKLLSSIFPYNTKFWKLWNLRKSEYAKAYQIDKVSHQITSFEEYQTLCDYKCAFGKIALDSLFLLAGKEHYNTYSKILESFKHFYTAFQISDDLTDYEEDAKDNQFNIAKYYLQKRLHKDSITVENYTITEQKKLVYLTGVNLNLHKKALHSLEQAKAPLLKINAPLWEEENKKLHTSLLSNYLNIDGYLKVFEAKKTLSHHKVSNNSIDEAIDLGINFIKKEQEDNGCWYDYFNDAGASNIWTSGFITTILSQKNNKKYDSLTSCFKNSTDFICKNINSDHVWGYNDVWMSDADSTTLSMLALQMQGKEISDISISEWLSYQKSDGGFSTYREKDKARLLQTVNEKNSAIKGWTNSHLCVSAVAYYFLSHFDSGTKFNDEKTRLKTYILHQLDTPQKHYSYWWTSFSYVLSFLIKGGIQENDTEIISKALKILDRLFTENEQEVDKIMKSYFYQGLLLDALCSTQESYLSCKSIIERIKENIIQNQYADGSWETSYCLRIPHINTMNPNDIESWKKNGTGANSLINDYHRLFSTSVCISGLSQYLQVTKQLNP